MTIGSFWFFDPLEELEINSTPKTTPEKFSQKTLPNRKWIKNFKYPRKGIFVQKKKDTAVKISKKMISEKKYFILNLGLGAFYKNDFDIVFG